MARETLRELSGRMNDSQKQECEQEYRREQYKLANPQQRSSGTRQRAWRGVHLDSEWMTAIASCIAGPKLFPTLCGGEHFATEDVCKNCQAILHWNDSTIPKLAERIREGRDWASMTVLADALEDAGAQEESILLHLRADSDKPLHAKACWVLSLILGLPSPQRTNL